MLPDTKNVTVVVGTSPIEKFWKEEIAKEAEPLDKPDYAFMDRSFVVRRDTEDTLPRCHRSPRFSGS